MYFIRRENKSFEFFTNKVSKDASHVVVLNSVTKNAAKILAFRHPDFFPPGVDFFEDRGVVTFITEFFLMCKPAFSWPLRGGG